MLLYQTMLYFPAQLMGPLFQFLAAVVWTHWLLPPAYGILAYVIAAQELSFLVGLSWWTSYTLRFLPTLDTERARSRYLATEGTTLWLAALVQAAVAVLTLRLVDAPLTLGLVASTLLFTVSRSLATHLGERARARGDVVAYTVGVLASFVVGFGLAYLAMAFVAATPAAALAGFALAQMAAITWLARRLALRLTPARPDAGVLAAAVRYGLPLVVSGAIGWVSVNGIRVVVQHGAGAEAVGLISVGWGLGQRIASVGAMLVTAAAFPIAVKALHAGGREESLRQLSLNAALLVGFVMPMSVGVLLVSRPLVELLIAQPFRAVTLAVLPIAVVAGAVRNLRVHFGDQIFLLTARTMTTIVVNGVEGVAVVVGCSIGLAYGGLAGAAAGCLAGILIGCVVGFALAIHGHGLRLPLDHVARIALATSLMALALGVCPWPAGAVGLAIEIPAGMAVYGVALGLLYPSLIQRGCRRVLAWG